MTPQLSWRRALAWRMARHHLITRAEPTDLARVAGDLCGLHAQVMSCAELSLWARIDDLSREQVREALWTRRTLVKLWAARGTLYLLPSAGLRTWLAALSTLPKFGNAGHPVIDELTGAVGRALDGRTLSRDELAGQVAQITGSPDLGELVRSSWGSYLKAASFRGLLCFAESQGAQVRFTSPRTWVPEALDRAREEDPDTALRDVTRQFLARYAPVTPGEVAAWWVGPPQPRRGLAMLRSLGDQAVEVEIEADRAWALAQDVPGLTSAAAPDVARLLPAFDPWVISAPRREPVLSPERVRQVYRPQGWISPVMIVNGRTAGVWRHARTGTRLTVELSPFDRLPPWARGQLETEAERLAVFAGGNLSVTWAE